MDVIIYKNNLMVTQMQVNDIYNVNITDMNEFGNGIAKIDGFVVFVKNAVAGDTAEIKIYEIKKKYAKAEIVNILQKSSYRTCPPCQDYDECGGCTLQHVNFELENNIKKNTLISSLKKNGILWTEKLEITALSRYNYRNKITLHFSEKQSAFGLYSEKTHNIVIFKGCLLCDPIINEIGTYINSIASSLAPSKPEYLTIWIGIDNIPSLSIKTLKNIDGKILNELLYKFPNLSFIANNTVDNYEDSILDLRMKYSSVSFRQVNKNVFSEILKHIEGLVSENYNKTIIDLYCGSGVISLYLAKHFQKTSFYGIEIDNNAVENARMNAKINKLENISFICEDSSYIKKICEKINISPFDTIVIVDPPRSGLSSESLNSILTLKPYLLIYVSCNPQSLSRDMKLLLLNKYHIKSLKMFNMFPSTSHVETVVLMSRKDT